jgi:hypothetical protein
MRERKEANRTSEAGRFGRNPRWHECFHDLKVRLASKNSSLDLMFFYRSLKIVAIASMALHLGPSVLHAQRRGLEAQVITGNPPGLIKKVDPEFPPDVVLRGASGEGVFRLTLNPKSDEVNEVKIAKSCGYKILNELGRQSLAAVAISARHQRCRSNSTSTEADASSTRPR